MVHQQSEAKEIKLTDKNKVVRKGDDGFDEAKAKGSSGSGGADALFWDLVDTDLANMRETFSSLELAEYVLELRRYQHSPRLTVSSRNSMTKTSKRTASRGSPPRKALLQPERSRR